VPTTTSFTPDLVQSFLTLSVSNKTLTFRSLTQADRCYSDICVQQFRETWSKKKKLFALSSATLPGGTEVLVLKVTVFWVVTPYSLVNVYGRLSCTATSYIYSDDLFYLFVFVLYLTVRDWSTVSTVEIDIWGYRKYRFFPPFEGRKGRGYKRVQIQVCGTIRNEL
jgi:uncharacterized protein YqhQ